MYFKQKPLKTVKKGLKTVNFASKIFAVFKELCKIYKKTLPAKEQKKNGRTLLRPPAVVLAVLRG